MLRPATASSDETHALEKESEGLEGQTVGPGPRSEVIQMEGESDHEVHGSEEQESPPTLTALKASPRQRIPHH